MNFVGVVQLYVVLTLGVVCFGLEIFALVDVLRRPAGVFVAAGKRTKGFWTAILVGAAALGFIALPPPVGAGFLSSLGFLSIVAVIAAAVYLTDVRPAVRQIRGGGGGRSGPYGPW